MNEKFYENNWNVSRSQPEPRQRLGDTPLELNAAVLNSGTSAFGTAFFGWQSPKINGSNIIPKLFVEWEGKVAYEHPQAIMSPGQTSVAVTHLPPGTLIEAFIENPETGALSNCVPLIIPGHPYAPLVVLKGVVGDPTAVAWTIVNGTGVTVNATVIHRFNPDGMTVTTFDPSVQSSASDHVFGETYYFSAYHVTPGPFQTNYGNLAKVVIQQASTDKDPTGLRVTGSTNGRTDFAWNLNAAVGSVFFDWRVKGAASWTTVPRPSGTTTHFLSGLAPFTEYEARVRVSDAGTNPTDTVVFYGNGTRRADFD